MSKIGGLNLSLSSKKL